MILRIIAAAINFCLVSAYTDSLADCQEFASLFENTCTNEIEVDDWSTASTLSVTCEGPNMCVGETTYDLSSDYSCTHQMKLCITCEQLN